MSDEQGPQLRNVQWLARILGMTTRGVYHAVARGNIPPELVVRLGRSVRFKETERLQWLEAGGTAAEQHDAA